MNKQMPSKGCDPVVFNNAVRNRKGARKQLDRVGKKGDFLREALAKIILGLAEEQVRVAKGEQVFTHAGVISRGKTNEWVLRA